MFLNVRLPLSKAERHPTYALSQHVQKTVCFLGVDLFQINNSLSQGLLHSLPVGAIPFLQVGCTPPI